MKHLENIERSAFRAGYAMHGPSLGYISERLADPVLPLALIVESYP